MNKKLLFGACAASFITFAASCSSDDIAAPSQAGNEVTVQFSPTIGGAMSRAIADGSTATTLKYAVYSNGVALKLDGFHDDGYGTATASNGSFSDVSLTLVSGNTYDIVFWADAGENSPYTFNVSNGTISYKEDATLNCNSENLDAFYYAKTGYEAKGGSEKITLTRPFAQINLGTNDIDAAIAAGFTPASSSITVSDAYTSFDLINGSASGNTSKVIFNTATIPTGDFPKTDYSYLATTYVLAGATHDVTLNVTDGGSKSITRSYSAVPAKANYRTNIYGALLTGTDKFQIEIEAGFTNPDNEVAVWDGTTITSPEYDTEQQAYIIDSPSDLAGFLTGNVTSASRAATSKNFILEGNVDMGGNTLQPQTGLYDFYGITFDGNGYTVSGITVPNNNSNVCALFPQGIVATVKNVTFANITIGNENIESGKDQYAGVVFGKTYGTCLVENVNVVNSTVYGVNKVGVIYGFVGEDSATISNCTVDGCEVYGIGSDAGCVGGILGYVASTVEINKCSVSNTIISAKNGENKSSRGNAYIVGASEGTLTINDCTIGEGNTLISNCTWNPYIGTDRYGKGNITIDNESVTISGIGSDTQISSLADLKTFAEKVNYGINYHGKAITLTADIDLNNEEWAPIGTSSNPFKGTFDGCNHTISNLYVNKPNTRNVGFFGNTNSGSVSNLKINNANVTGYLNVGAVSGQPYTSKYNDIELTGNVYVNGFAYVGGMFGKNLYASASNLTINANQGSYVSANSIENDIEYRTYVGGVVGFMGESSNAPIVVKNVTTNIDVIGTTCDAGGVTGIAHYGNKFENCVASGNVSLTNADEKLYSEIGGIAGVWLNSKEANVEFNNCSFSGKLSSKRGETTYDVSNNIIVGAKYTPSSDEGELIITNSTQE